MRVGGWRDVGAWLLVVSRPDGFGWLEFLEKCQVAGVRDSQSSWE